jgi:hypothetical protein
LTARANGASFGARRTLMRYDLDHVDRKTGAVHQMTPQQAT